MLNTFVPIVIIFQAFVALVAVFFIYKKIKLEKKILLSLRPIIVSNAIATSICFVLLNLAAVYIFNDGNKLSMTLLTVASFPLLQIILLLLYYVGSNWTKLSQKIKFFDVFWGVVASYGTTFLLILIEVYFYFA